MKRNSRILRVIGTMAGLSLLVAAGTAAADSKAFIAKHNGWSRATFESDAPIESIVGVTTRVDGNIQVDPSKLETAKGKVSIDVAGFRTGIKMRDEHLRSKMWLDADTYPKIEFELTKISGDATALEPGKYVRTTAVGKLTIKGKSRDVEIPVRVGIFPVPESLKKMMKGMGGELLRISGTLQLKLSDYGVEIPSMLGMKVSDEVKVRVDVTAAGM